jgi:hypothetical protein
MAAISKGTTFATGDQVTASGLNNLVDNSTFASGAVDNTSTQLSGGAIIVKDGGVTTAKLNDGAVTTAKISDANVTTAKIADSNVTTAKIADANVTTAKIADSNVTTAKIADSNVTFAKLADVIDDNTMATATDTTLATSESIKAYVDASSVKIASYEKASGSTGSTIVLPVTEVSDPSNIGSVSSGTVTLAAGTYLVVFNGEFAEDDNDLGDFFTVSLRHNGAVQTSDKIDETGSIGTYVSKSRTILVSGDSSQTVDIRLTESGSTTLYYRNVSLNFIKIA